MFDGWEAQAPVVGRIAFAMLLGGAIGLEREMKDRPAGFRTHMLVADRHGRHDAGAGAARG